ncbi:acetyl-CoA hydrolase/transferase C-terminal domain-containing protein [Marinicella sp. W31]|uniref:acetyl-CoA hydrolase/transferase C-terminal domain-containing protein n=1 Tax=Marinicella sp. W31 TaxID=3023713 RepID=UPI003756E801
MVQRYDNFQSCVDAIVASVGYDLVVGTPLGIGKPNHLMNALWAHARQNQDIHLEIFTALSLNKPQAKSLLQERFLQPFSDRHFGTYPDLDYVHDLEKGDLPARMKVTEFYMQSGKHLYHPLAQCAYTSSNYTHVVRDMINRGVNVVVQMVAADSAHDQYSLGSNPDLTLDLMDEAQRKKIDKPLMVGVINHNMPFMYGDALVDADFFDILLETEAQYPLYAVPKQSINPTDHMIGLLASQLVPDGGTLQIGIGSLGDAFVNASIIRQQQSDQYQACMEALKLGEKFPSLYNPDHCQPFTKGLYAASEMFMEGFQHLYNADILKRKVYEHTGIQQLLNAGIIEEKIDADSLELMLTHEAIPYFLNQKDLLNLQSLGVIRSQCKIENGIITTPTGQQITANLHQQENRQRFVDHCLGDHLSNGHILHAAFFLGSNDFYHWLHDLKPSERALFQMTRVSRVNQLYGGEALDRVQRVKARFINTTMKVNLTGAACSDGLSNHQIVSGIGGQYNFVAMAHALDDSRSILMLRSTRNSASGVESNIVWDYPYISIPRHLRDIVITEYGYADLRSKSDEACIKALLCITDSRFQNGLMETAKRHHKLDPSWSIPDAFRHNTPDSIKAFIKNHEKQFPAYPFGSDFSEEELVLIKALGYLKRRTKNRFSTLETMLGAAFSRADQNTIPYLKRMQLLTPKNLQEKIAQKMLLWALKKKI